jgi:hypothetical protein
VYIIQIPKYRGKLFSLLFKTLDYLKAIPNFPKKLEVLKCVVEIYATIQGKLSNTLACECCNGMIIKGWFLLRHLLSICLILGLIYSFVTSPAAGGNSYTEKITLIREQRISFSNKLALSLLSRCLFSGINNNRHTINVTHSLLLRIEFVPALHAYLYNSSDELSISENVVLRKCIDCCVDNYEKCGSTSIYIM